MDKLKIIIYSTIRFLLRAFWIFPVNRKRLVFLSFSNKSYACSPKYIYRYLKQHSTENLEYVWILNSDISYDDLKGVKCVPKKTILFYYYMMTAAVIINNNIAPSYYPFRKSQLIIGTWHGGGSYKKWGIDVHGGLFNRKTFQIVADNVTYVISSCKAFSDSLMHAGLINKDKILPIGMPRNDLFFDNLDKNILYIKERLNISATAKVVLYAPTFRGLVDTAVYKRAIFDHGALTASLNKKFGGEWTILFRAHYALSEFELPDSMIDVSAYPDMQELLLISDVLINDYSSSMWDFSLMKKPCFIYAEDIEEYSRTRGFYTPMDQWPFPIASTQEELIRNIEQFDEETYRLAVDRHHEELGSYETGTATKTICKIICDYCGVTLDEHNL